MSVVVRMEMPKGCWGCPFGHYDWIWGDDGREKMVCFCCLDGESEEDGHYLLETEEKRPSWCPIICSLPEGHGRLAESPSPKPTDHVPKPTDPVPIRDVYYVMTECDAKTGTVKYEPRERIEL